MSFVNTLIPLMKNGRISLISMEQRPESYARVRNEVGGKERGTTYTEFAVVQLCDTISTLGLPRLSDVFEKGANLIRVLKVI